MFVCLHCDISVIDSQWIIITFNFSTNKNGDKRVFKIILFKFHEGLVSSIIDKQHCQGYLIREKDNLSIIHEQNLIDVNDNKTTVTAT